MLDVKLLQNFCVISWRCCPGPQKHRWPSWNCFVYSITSFLFSTHVCSLPGFNVVQHRNEYDPASEIPRFRGPQEFLNFFLDLDRCVAWTYVPMGLHWSARDVMFVHECRRVPCFRKCCRQCLIRKGVVVSHTHDRVREHMNFYSQPMNLRLVVAAELNYSRILCSSFAVINFHTILRQYFWGVQVWFAQLQ